MIRILKKIGVNSKPDPLIYSTVPKNGLLLAAFILFSWAMFGSCKE
jgi:hypothetical protein